MEVSMEIIVIVVAMNNPHPPITALFDLREWPVKVVIEINEKPRRAKND
jgi:hypothetical protein